MVAVEVVHFLMAFVVGIGDGAHGGRLAHAGCLFSAVDLTVLLCGIWRKSLPRFILKQCSGHMQYNIERAARTRKIFAQLCFGLHQMVICADAQR